LLFLQLQVWGPDPIMHQSMHRARAWLGELLFS
jgi:hypothetical protein